MTTLRRSALLLALFALGCSQPLKLAHDDSGVVLAHQLLDAPNPAEPGPFRVLTLYYGSGTDRNRAVYRDSVTIRTKPVDGSKLASAPNAKETRSREKFWGFGFSRMPINGRVWYPDGPGPFPLVLIVHGNHDMKKFSDPGYGYLGELLASRGFILASVDENFLNGFIRNENDARAWMLLQHLKAWRGFNDSAGSPFYHKVDTTNIALMGHSRGGEAVAVAAAFNTLTHYPDDATITFDFHFGIRSVVAIAPVDGQYEPANRPTPLENVNYLVIHGSHDGDVSTFSGLRQYERIRFTDGQPWFKSAVYVYRANHGQWNTVWGSTDAGPRSDRSLDLRGLLSPEEQRRFGKVYISAFLESTLHGRHEYLPLFRDHRVIGGWLPKTMYITRFQDSRFHTLADYHEDVDVTTGSASGVRLEGDSLSVWKEAVVPSRWKNSDMGHNAVWLGWNRHVAGSDSATLAAPASYAVTIPDSLDRAWGVGTATSLEFSLAPTNDVPGPRKAPKDTSRQSADSSASREAPSRKPKQPGAAPHDGRKAAADDTIPMDLTIELVDAAGTTARVPLSRYGAVRRPLVTHVLRRADREKERFAATFEIVLQSYVIPLADFARTAPGFDPSRLTTVRFLFDRTPAGTVALDDIGLSAIDPAFLAVAVAPR